MTIHGARFSRVEAVIIGGKKARSLHLRSPTVLTVVTPRHPAGSAAIKVVTKAGTSPPSTARFHYLNRPRLTGLSAHSALVTGGQVVTISGSGLAYVTAVKFGPLRASMLPRPANRRLRVRVPASWAGTVQVTVRTPGGVTARSAAARFTFRNPAPQLSGQLTPAAGDVAAAGSDVTAVSGGPAIGQGASQAPWDVTLAPSATVPSVGQQFLLKPGGPVCPAGLAGTVTAADTTAGTITVAPSPLDAAVQSVQAVFTGPLGDPAAASAGHVRRYRLGLANTINFGSIPASALDCTNWAQYVAKTPDGGRSWMKSTISKFPAKDDMFAISLSCPDAGHCVAIEIGAGPAVIVVS